jgi:hypothetical protein
LALWLSFGAGDENSSFLGAKPQLLPSESMLGNKNNANLKNREEKECSSDPTTQI